MKSFLATILLAPIVLMAQQEQAPAVVTVPMPAEAQPYTCGQQKAAVFQSNDILEITMKGTFPTTRVAAAPAEIKYRDEATQSEKAIPIQVMSRGKSRASCQFQPIRILWGDQKQLRDGTLFDHTKGSDMKLTAHCRYTTGTIEQNSEVNEVIIKEYMMYKVLKAFGLPVFDVRLAKIQYVDPTDIPTVQGLGFFIESSVQYADRCHLVHAKRPDIDQGTHVSGMKNVVQVPYLFSRLITDARDFIVNSGHNTEPFMSANKVTEVVVPYDFNDSGQVVSGIAPFWNFTPNMDFWFNQIRQGPFTRDGNVTQLTDDEKKIWASAVIAEAEALLQKKSAVVNEIENSPLQKKSKEKFKAHIEMITAQLQRIVDDKATPQAEMVKPAGIW